jgi:hypothetical protein
VIKEGLVSPSFSFSFKRCYSCKMDSKNTKKDSYLNREENKVIDNDKFSHRDFELNKLKKEIVSDSKKVTKLIIISLNKGR